MAWQILDVADGQDCALTNAELIGLFLIVTKDINPAAIEYRTLAFRVWEKLLPVVTRALAASHGKS
jgi:hypothetical protein